MTTQEIKEELLKHISDGMNIKFSTFPKYNGDTEIDMSYTSKNPTDFMKKKAVMDALTKMLVDNGYIIKMSSIDISDTYYQSVMLEKKGDKKNEINL